jgi:8-oxo-dGTP diphosphatase
MTNPKILVSPLPGIGVSGIAFNHNNDVLLIKRNQAPASGLWSIPGGKLEPGESLTSCCQREFFEETAVNVEVSHIVAVVERKLEGFHYVIIDFLVRLIDEQNSMPVAQSDVTDARWVSLSELDNYPLVDGLKDIILRTFNSLTKSNLQLTGLHSNATLTADYILPEL